MSHIRPDRAFAVKVAAKRLPVSPFSGFDVYHHFRNDAFHDLYNLLIKGHGALSTNGRG